MFRYFAALGSPWEVDVLDESARMSSKACVIGEGVRHFAASKIASFDIDLCGALKDQVKSHNESYHSASKIVSVLPIGECVDNKSNKASLIESDRRRRW